MDDTETEYLSASHNTKDTEQTGMSKIPNDLILKGKK